MKRIIGTRSMGLRTPIIKEGDSLLEILPGVLENAVEYENITLHDMDVLAVTESLLARSQGNYCNTEDIVKDLDRKFDERIGVVFPITSRNRFSVIMKAIADTGKKVDVFLNYPQDEVGNALFDKKILVKKDINVNTDTLSEKEYRDLVGYDYVHPFTGVDYVELYKSYGDNIRIWMTNNPYDIRKITDEVLICNIHEREYYKELFENFDMKTVLDLSDIMNESVDGSGYNEEFGLYGSNLSGDTRVKLFPRESQKFAEELQAVLVDQFGKDIQVMVYGDGAFKDPVGKIWELADPVVSPGFTKKLEGKPNEIKIKYLADNELKDKSGGDMEEAMKKKISEKDDDLTGKQESLGTTPRRITDLLGSLADLTSGSGDKGTPVVLIQGYFDNFATD